MIDKRLKKAIERLLTLEDLKDIFKVQTMTIYRWRSERGLSDCEVPIPSRGRASIRFDLDAVLEWAQKENIKTPGLQEWRKEHQQT